MVGLISYLLTSLNMMYEAESKTYASNTIPQAILLRVKE
jgi:hypothetical protein